LTSAVTQQNSSIKRSAKKMISTIFVALVMIHFQEANSDDTFSVNIPEDITAHALDI
jgi:hypothetical protein